MSYRETPQSKKVPWLSPTGLQVMDACQLRFAFGQQPASARRSGTPASVLGEFCHHILETMVKERRLWAESWAEQLAALWTDGLEGIAESTGQTAAGWGRPEQWPDYQLKKARFRHMTERLRHLLLTQPEGTEFLTEEALADRSGLLRGRADLVLRRPGNHRIIDYKTGRAVDRVTGAVRDAYTVQLQLYAYMEHETTGEWPLQAYIYPLEGEPVSLAIDPREAIEVAERGLALLRVYNSRAPGDQVSNPTPDNCRYCPYAGDCPGFWSVYDDSWRHTLLAIVGTATEVFHTRMGSTNLTLSRVEGLMEASVLLKNISDAANPIVMGIAAGRVVAVVGFRQEHESNHYYLPSGALIATR